MKTFNYILIMIFILKNNYIILPFFLKKAFSKKKAIRINNDKSTYNI